VVVDVVFGGGTNWIKSVTKAKYYPEIVATITKKGYSTVMEHIYFDFNQADVKKRSISGFEFIRELPEASYENGNSRTYRQ